MRQFLLSSAVAEHITIIQVYESVYVSICLLATDLLDKC